MTVIIVTDENFKDLVLNSKLTVLVLFYAPWCGPCRDQLVTLDQLDADYSGKILVCKLNTDESPNTSSQYGLRSDPTFMLFKNGGKVDEIIGGMPRITISQMIDKHL